MAAWLRHRACLLAAFVIAGTLAASPGASAREFDVGPAPAWVTAQLPELEAKAPQDQVAGGSHYLLVDHQVRVSGGDRVVYRHVAARALNERGVESLANVEVRFDPAFQRLTLHTVQLRRGGQVIDRLSPAAVKVLQRETELDALIFDGSRTAHLFLEDVRVGDVVEYSYSLRGQNPVFEGRQFSRVEMQWGVPVRRAQLRLLWPQGRPLQVQARNGAPEARVVDGPAEREYRWEARDIAPQVVERDAPAWHDPYATVQWSEFAGWPEVARWALPLYRLPERPGPRVAAVVAEIAAREASPEGRLLAALRYVQSQVRYLGVEIGAGSHAPNPPELVLQRRFGDCKDKTLLTVALLRGLGLQAEPALVNTSQQRAIAGWQPSPGAFNHVVVHARLAGRRLWLDPTRAAQSGRLEQLVQAEYGPALRVASDTTGLDAMAGEAVLAQRREVTIEIDSSSGHQKPAPLSVTTVALGATAESLRNTLANQSREVLQKNYTNFYASRFQGLSMSSPLKVDDDSPANRLTMTERYTVDRFWRRSDERQRHEAEVLVPDLYEMLRTPQTTLRHAPLHTGHPIDLVHVTRVRLPSGFSIKPEDHRLEDPAFEFNRRTAMEGDTLVLRDHFRTLAAEVAPAEVPRYVANLE